MGLVRSQCCCAPKDAVVCSSARRCLISTPPSERGPITYLSSYSEEKVSSAIKFELDCSGQVFYALPCNKGLEEVLQFLERSFPDVARAIEVAGLKHDEEYYQVGGGDDNEGDGGGNDDEDGGEDDSDGDEEDEDLGGSNGEGDWEDGEDEEDEEDDDEEDEEDSEDEEDDDEEDGEDEEHEEGEEDEEGEGPQDGEEDYEKDSEDDEIDEDVHIMDILEGYEVHGITHSGRDALFNEFLTHRNIDREEFLKWLTGRGDEKSLWWSKFLLLMDDDCEKVLETVCKLWSRSQKKHLSGKARILDMKRVFALRQIKAAGIKIKDWFFYVSKGQGIDEPEEWWEEVESYPKGLLTTRLYLYTRYCREFLRKLGREVGDFVEDWEQDTSSEDGGGGDDGLRGDND